MQLAYAALKAKEEQLLEDRRVLTHKTRPSIQRRLREAYSRQATPKRRASNGPYGGVQYDQCALRRGAYMSVHAIRASYDAAGLAMRPAESRSWCFARSHEYRPC